jgi:aldose 1-epimerase
MVIQEKVAYFEKRDIIQYTLVNKNGIKVSFLNYGGVITKLITPDKIGKFENIVLSHENIEDYFINEPYYGALVGRVVGRISNAEFLIDDTKYHLTKNDGNNSAHGGKKNFTHVIWNCKANKENAVELSYDSIDGEEGYPGNLKVKVTYELNDDDEFIINYEGVSDKKTIFNPTSHSYFNLSGENRRDILEHFLTIDSSKFLELTEEYLPTGRMLPVDRSIFDFRDGRNLEEVILSDNEQILLAKNGLNHPFILDKYNNYDVVLSDNVSGRELRVKTDTASVVIYTGNELPPEKRHHGICVETQGLPDAVNNPSFPSIILLEEKEYKTSTIYKFSVN